MIGRMKASLECMIFFIRISRKYVVSIHSVFLFLVAAIFNCDKS